MKNAWMVGIDEAGRGPLAGPVTLAYVACPSRFARRALSLSKGNKKENIRDSKKLTLKKREEWFRHLKAHPHLEYGVTSVGAGTIDTKGISRSVKIGIKRLVSHLSVKPKMILLDGLLYAPPEYPQKTIIKGDEKIPIIAAASVIAKVTRDRKMIRFAKKFPNYSFEIHKGYGTKLHQRLLKKHGLSDIHRRSFCRKISSSLKAHQSLNGPGLPKDTRFV